MLMYVDPHSTVVKRTFFSSVCLTFLHNCCTLFLSYRYNIYIYLFISFYDPYVIFSIPVLLYLLYIEFFFVYFFIIHIFIPMKKKFYSLRCMTAKRTSSTRRTSNNKQTNKQQQKLQKNKNKK